MNSSLLMDPVSKRAPFQGSGVGSSWTLRFIPSPGFDEVRKKESEEFNPDTVKLLSGMKAVTVILTYTCRPESS